MVSGEGTRDDIMNLSLSVLISLDYFWMSFFVATVDCLACCVVVIGNDPQAMVCFEFFGTLVHSPP